MYVYIYIYTYVLFIYMLHLCPAHDARCGCARALGAPGAAVWCGVVWCGNSNSNSIVQYSVV